MGGGGGGGGGMLKKGSLRCTAEMLDLEPLGRPTGLFGLGVVSSSVDLSVFGGDDSLSTFPSLECVATIWGMLGGG